MVERNIERVISHFDYIQKYFFTSIEFFFCQYGHVTSATIYVHTILLQLCTWLKLNLQQTRTSQNPCTRVTHNVCLRPLTFGTYLVNTAAMNQASRHISEARVFVQMYPAFSGLQMA